MHHIEAVLSGLPVIYKNSGALPEYCKNFGVSFDFLEFEGGGVENFDVDEFVKLVEMAVELALFEGCFSAVRMMALIWFFVAVK